MKANDVFADEVIIDRPSFGKRFFVCAITKCSDVVGEGIKPHVSHMRFVPWKWNTPSECFATDRKIVESTFDETDYFVHAEARCDGLWVIGIPLEQTVFKA